MTNIIDERCLGSNEHMRDVLLAKCDMGRATSPAEVVIAISNFQIIHKQMITHHDTVTGMVDIEKTAYAR